VNCATVVAVENFAVPIDFQGKRNRFLNVSGYDSNIEILVVFIDQTLWFRAAYSPKVRDWN
jgi:hypothetical protein